MITAGVDIGSVATKLVLLRDGTDIAAKALCPSGAAPQRAADQAFGEALASAALKRSDVQRVVATGYGRRRVAFGDRVVTEVTTCARGARWRADDVRVVLDLGGQDVKVVLLDEKGAVEDFAMNDKCAAGTGRFLEVIARALEVGLDEMGALALQSRNPCRINSTCTVFAESEVVTLVARGERVEDIIAGIHISIAARIATMLGNMGKVQRVLFCGGGARNDGLRQALADKLGADVIVADHAQFVNAIGAALIAADG